MMHDLVNDVAKVVAGDTCFRLEDKLTASNKEKARHSSYIPGLYDRCERFEPFERIKHMRTFLPLSLQRIYEILLSKLRSSYLLSKLQCLRVLSFKYYNITELPDSIGDLKHLRYLDLSYTDIVTLPETTTSLCNLQTLLLNGCYRLNKLPSEMQNLIKLRHLDMENTYAGMPQGIEALKSLRILSDFVVGKGNEEVGITALMNLKFLQGALRISCLDNVSNASDVRGAILLDKERIDYLVMEDGDRGVLEMMKPHGNLKNLTIWNYGGIQFPLWVGDPLFSNLVRLQLLNCKNCTTLPQLGLLSSLKDFVIEGFPNVKAIDMNSNPFPALETLTFNYMEEWEEWNIRGCEFSHLRKLSIDGCPKLLGKLPSHLPSLQELYIRECLQLMVSFESLPMISNLISMGAKSFKSLRKVFIGNCSRLVSLPDAVIYNSLCLEELRIESCHSLISIGRHQLPPTLVRLEIIRCNKLQMLLNVGEACSSSRVENEESMSCHASLSNLQYLKIIGCDSYILRTVPASLKIWLLTVSDLPEKLTSLNNLSITGRCPGMVSFPQDEIDKELPASLVHLTIEGFEDLKYLSKGFQNLPSIEHVKLKSCPKLASFPENGLPPSLLTLYIYTALYLKKEILTIGWVDWEHETPNGLRQYLGGELPASLKDLVIDSSSYAEGFPTNLTSLYINKVEICTPLFNWGLHRLTSLEKVSIKRGCPGVVSFPQDELPASLTALHIKGFEDLKYLSNRGFESLSSIEFLILDSCPKLASFPNNGLPPSLLQLCIRNCPVLQQRCEKGKGQESLEVAHIPYVEFE
ncbi:hypothetical protein GH714_000152 [Hevea brasiliensis]|uniref:Disease resistance R13L4/SHOC-2-like LRR domain-containing protein n=1 Tax=Hevea brasiliensis TaxID=3981 RepID=A0A6A6M5N5_HEVBR|nr:hypothetical protein GH714_000152 [Hevea brasiliensis]